MISVLLYFIKRIFCLIHMEYSKMHVVTYNMTRNIKISVLTAVLLTIQIFASVCTEPLLYRYILFDVIVA